MNTREQWRAAWRMARRARRSTSLDPPYLQRPEWIWDAFCGRRLREVPEDAVEERMDRLRSARWTLGHALEARARYPNDERERREVARVKKWARGVRKEMAHGLA